MNDIFNLRSFVENQLDRLSIPTTVLLNKFLQTIDSMKSSFTSLNNTNDRNTNTSFNPYPSTNSLRSHYYLSSPTKSNTHSSLIDSKLLPNADYSQDNSFLQRYLLSERYSSDNPQLFNKTTDRSNVMERSRSLIRGSIDSTYNVSNQNTLRRIESFEIPGLNGVKSIRYIHSDLGKLEPDLYRKQTIENDPGYNSGQIKYSIFYNQTLTCLSVKLISIDNLPYRDFKKKILPNPYIKITLLTDRRKKYQTQVYKHVQKLEINETFQFQIGFEQLFKRSLLFSIYDFHRSSKRNIIGTIKIDDIYSISELRSREVLFLQDLVPGTDNEPDLGDLTVSLCYLPNAKRVTITIIKGNCLKSMDITGKSDPYVKVLLFINGKRSRKKKTSVRWNTLDPVYNESLEFDLSKEELETANFIFKVIDYDRIGSNELIGCFGIGTYFDGPNRDHWYEMLEHPHVPITHNYILHETVPIIACENIKAMRQTK